MSDEKRAYYITAYADEATPCDPTLEAWANWLSKPDAEWRRSQAAADGEQFPASVYRFATDIVARRDPFAVRGWSLSREPVDADFMAVRFGQGLGWSGDNIIWGEDMRAALLDWLSENDAYCDDVEYVAVASVEPNVLLTYHAGPPPSLVEKSIQ